MTTLTAHQAGRLTLERPLFRRPEAERYTIVRALEGVLCTVILDHARDGKDLRELDGVVIGITSNPGVGAALVIFRTERGTLHALSSAHVRRIVPR
jgi:hypothetical protein